MGSDTLLLAKLHRLSRDLCSHMEQLGINTRDPDRMDLEAVRTRILQGRVVTPGDLRHCAAIIERGMRRILMTVGVLCGYDPQLSCP